MTRTNDVPKETNDAPKELPRFDQVARELRLKELEQCLTLDDQGKKAAFQDAESRFDQGKEDRELLSPECGRRYALFKLLVQEDGKLRWQALKELSLKEKPKAKEKKPKAKGKRKEPSLWDTDGQVLKLWEQLKEDLDDQKDSEIDTHRWSLIYHRHWLFDWLLSRYDIRRAREVLGGGFWSTNAHLFLGLAILVIFVLRRDNRLEPFPTLYTAVLCLLTYMLLVAGLSKGFRAKLSDWPEAIALALQSLIPRLAGASAVGLVILASSQELLRVVVAANKWWLPGFLLAGYGYLLLEMARRVYPSPPLTRLLGHGFDIVVTAFAHSVTLALLAEGGLRRVLAESCGNPADPFSLWQSLNVAVFVFAIGLVVNLIWAEQPVTEPL